MHHLRHTTASLFKKPRVAEAASAKFIWRENIGRLAVEVNTYDQVAKFSATGWDPNAIVLPVDL